MQLDVTVMEALYSFYHRFAYFSSIVRSFVCQVGDIAAVRNSLNISDSQFIPFNSTAHNYSLNGSSSHLL